MKWNRSEIERLSPILEQIATDLAPVDGKRIVVLCSAAGEVVFRLAEMMESGRVTGLELDPEALENARRATHEMGLGSIVEFLPVERDSLPLESESFDALVSEFIVYPTRAPTEIGQGEMARVLVPGGKLILTDVIAARPLANPVREELEAIGLDYLCEATEKDFRSWMVGAGLINVVVEDLTSILQPVWEARQENDLASTHRRGYEYLLEDPQTSLGSVIKYLYIKGEKANDSASGMIRLV